MSNHSFRHHSFANNAHNRDHEAIQICGLNNFNILTPKIQEHLMRQKPDKKVVTFV